MEQPILKGSRCQVLLDRVNDNELSTTLKKSLSVLVRGAILSLLFVNQPLKLSAQDVKFETVKVESQVYLGSSQHDEWRNYTTRVLSDQSQFEEVEQTIYGSKADTQYEATGFFRTQKIDGRWWIVDPYGHLHCHRGVAGVRPGSSPASEAAFAKIFKTDKGWVSSTSKKLYELDFYGIGAWSSDLFITYNKKAKEPIAVTKILDFMSSYGKKRGGTYQRAGNIGYPNQTIFVFDPEFETYCDAYAKKVTAPFKGDKSIMGFFSDNEMPLGKANLEGYLTLEDPKDHGRKAAEAFLKSKGVDASQITDELRVEFAGIVAERYYSIVSKALKKHDPDHLYLGTRLHGGAKYVEGIIRAASAHCDIVSINFYGVWAPTKKYLNDLHEWGDAPFMITEFYAKALDSGLANNTGAGFRVKTQKDRGQFYQNFCLALLESKDFVGWHYFRYQDNDPNAKKYDPSNVDSNKGIVTNTYDYYDEFLDYMTPINNNAYQLIEYFDNQNNSTN